MGIILHHLLVRKRRDIDRFFEAIFWLYYLFFFCYARSVSIEISFLYQSWTESIIQCLVNFFHLEFIKVFIFTVHDKAFIVTLLKRLFGFFLSDLLSLLLFLRNLYLILGLGCLLYDLLNLKTEFRNIIFQHLIWMHQVLSHVILLVVDFHWIAIAFIFLCGLNLIIRNQ